MKTISMLCGVTLAVSLSVGCAAPADGDNADEAVAGSQSDLSEGTGSATGGYDPTVTKPVAWACNFISGGSVVFVQSRVHSPYGTLSLYDREQDPNGSFGTLVAGSGQEASTVLPVKFSQAGQLVSFTETELASKPTAMTVTMGEKLRIGGRVFGWTGRMAGDYASEKEDLGGCWGVR
jgi:hypothetical protein